MVEIQEVSDDGNCAEKSSVDASLMGDTTRKTAKSTTSSTSTQQKPTKAQEKRGNVEQYNDLMSKMSAAREQWIAEDGDDDPDDPDHLLNKAIQLALEQGRGWGPGEKEAYLEKILDDDFIPPLFASTPEEVARSGLEEAFTSLIYDESPTVLVEQFRKKGNDAFANGRRSQVKNMQYYRDAINFWYEALAWALKIEPMEEGDLAQADTDEITYNERELGSLRSTLSSNLALAHLQLRNWGHGRTDAQRAVTFDPHNVKAWFRLAQSHEQLQDWEEAGNAIDQGLACPQQADNKDLLKLQRQLSERIRRARQRRQQRERARAERVAKVKAVWKHCNSTTTPKIRLGRVPLVASVTDDDENDHDDVEQEESRWHHHLPHSGMLPTASSSSSATGEWSWPCMFVYPSHRQSDFVADFGESELLAMRMAEVFPELDEGQSATTTMPWDTNNEFVCSRLAVYFEVHEAAVGEDAVNAATAVHPESVQRLPDQAAAMRFYESSRALKGDEGDAMATVAQLQERKLLARQRRAWCAEHGSLWANRPYNSPVVRVHPAMTLRDVLTDERMVVPNVSWLTCLCLVVSSRWNFESLSCDLTLFHFLTVPRHLHHVSRNASCTRGISQGAQMCGYLATTAIALL